RRRHTITTRDWSSDVCSSDLETSYLPTRKDWRHIATKQHRKPSCMTAFVSSSKQRSYHRFSAHLILSVVGRRDTRLIDAPKTLRSEERRVGNVCWII